MSGSEVMSEESASSGSEGDVMDSPPSRYQGGPVVMSIDVETDGPCVLKNSMLSFGVVVMDAKTGEIIEELQQQMTTLKGHTQDPKTMTDFWKHNPEAWRAATTRRVSPETAMSRVAAMVRRLKAKGCDLSWIAKPACFDWAWIKAYYEGFGPEWRPDIGFYCIDVRSVLTTYCDMTGENSFSLVKEITAGYPITHTAVDDARNQAVLYFGLKRRVNDAKVQATRHFTHWSKGPQCYRGRYRTFGPAARTWRVQQMQSPQVP